MIGRSAVTSAQFTKKKKIITIKKAITTLYFKRNGVFFNQNLEKNLVLDFLKRIPHTSASGVFYADIYGVQANQSS